MRSIIALFLLSAALISAQQSSPWKEYVFQDDKFAITTPAAPWPHADASNPEFTVYSIAMPDKIVLNFRVSSQNRDCDALLQQLSDGVRQGGAGMDPSSLKKLSLDGNPGIEYKWISPLHTNSDRYYCVKGKFYVFSASWTKNAPRPAIIDRVESSLRLLKPESK